MYWQKLLIYVWRVAFQHKATDLHLPKHKLNDNQTLSIRRVQNAIEEAEFPPGSPTQAQPCEHNEGSNSSSAQRHGNINKYSSPEPTTELGELLRMPSRPPRQAEHTPQTTLQPSSATTSITLRQKRLRHSTYQFLGDLDESDESDCSSVYTPQLEHSVQNTAVPQSPETLPTPRISPARTPNATTTSETLSIPITEELKLACTQLCSSLLDHRLPGQLIESLVVTFLAVLGIGPDRQRLLEATP